MEITDFGYFTVREPRRGEPSLLYFVNDLGQDWYEMRVALTEWDRNGVFVNAIYGAWAAVDAEGIVTNVEYDPSRLMPGDRTVLGYRVGPVAYVTDAKAIPPEAVARLTGLEVLVLNALLPRPHPLHLSVPEAVAAAQQIGARRTFLTHLTHDATHAELAARLPSGIAPAYDGLVIDLGAV